MIQRVIILFVLSTVVFRAPVYGEEVVILTGEWDPYVSAHLKDYGFTADIIREACLASGIKPTFQFAPWPRCEANVKYGKVFAAFPYTVTRERSVFSHFSEPFSKSRTVFFYHKKKLKPFTFEDLAELKHYLIGGVRGYYYEPLFEKKGLMVDYSDSETNAFKKLFHERVDMVPLNELVGWKLTRSLFPNPEEIFATSATALDESELTLMVSKRYPGAERLLKKFNKGLKKIQSTGVYHEIFERYGIPPSVSFPAPSTP